MFIKEKYWFSLIALVFAPSIFAAPPSSPNNSASLVRQHLVNEAVKYRASTLKQMDTLIAQGEHGVNNSASRLDQFSADFVAGFRLHDVSLAPGVFLSDFPEYFERAKGDLAFEYFTKSYMLDPAAWNLHARCARTISHVSALRYGGIASLQFS